MSWLREVAVCECGCGLEVGRGNRFVYGHASSVQSRPRQDAVRRALVAGALDWSGLWAACDGWGERGPRWTWEGMRQAVSVLRRRGIVRRTEDVLFELVPEQERPAPGEVLR